jgi:hypothetical protein
MATANANVHLSASPDEIWKLIGGFGSLPDWLPYIRKSALMDGGRVRHLETADGQAIVEQLEAYDHAGRTYSYSIVHAAFPVKDYLATLRVTPAGVKECDVTWSGSFTPQGVSDAEAHNLFQSIFSDGLKALASGLAEQKA